MKITAKIDYACRSIFELALHWPDTSPMQVNEIAKRQKIPLNFLLQILLNLKQQGLVKSTRGKRGGYVLAKSPSEIKLSDIVSKFSVQAEGFDVAANGNEIGAMGIVWKEVEKAVTDVFSRINFEDICDRVRDSKQAFVYEI